MPAISCLNFADAILGLRFLLIFEFHFHFDKPAIGIKINNAVVRSLRYDFLNILMDSCREFSSFVTI